MDFTETHEKVKAPAVVTDLATGKRWIPFFDSGLDPGTISARLPHSFQQGVLCAELSALIRWHSAECTQYAKAAKWTDLARLEQLVDSLRRVQ